MLSLPKWSLLVDHLVADVAAQVIAVRLDDLDRTELVFRHEWSEKGSLTNASKPAVGAMPSKMTMFVAIVRMRCRKIQPATASVTSDSPLLIRSNRRLLPELAESVWTKSDYASDFESRRQWAQLRSCGSRRASGWAICRNRPGPGEACWAFPWPGLISNCMASGGKLALLALAALAGVPICAIAARRLGGSHDPGCVVLDEVIGMAATLFMFDAWRPLTVVLAFILFRFFDILKPTPVREVERLSHGWGIMTDDLVAALYANLSLWIIAWLAGLLAPGLSHLM